MALIVRILFVILFHGLVIRAYDPDPVQDYCIATTDPATPCKNSSLVTVKDFIFSGLNSCGDFSEMGLAVKTVDVSIFPGLKTQGISIRRAEVQVGSVVLPHVHPRATEAVLVLEGTVYSGFIDTRDRVFSKIISEGDFMVIPKGLVHFQLNVGKKKKATVLIIYNSENPGTSLIPLAVFGCGMNNELLEKSFGLSFDDISKVRKYLGLCSGI